MVVDVMAGRYFDKLHPVRVSLGIGPAGGDGHDLILRAMNDGDGGRWWRWGLVETAVYLQIITQGNRPVEAVVEQLPYPISFPLGQRQAHPFPEKIGPVSILAKISFLSDVPRAWSWHTVDIYAWEA
jgi:hypothetical protein